MGISQAWSSTVVRRPVEDVWALVSDATRYEEWCDLFSFKGGQFEVGKRLKLLISKGGVTVPVSVKVTTFDADSEVRWEANLLGISGSHWIRVYALTENETQVLHGEDYRGIGWIWPYVRKDVHEEYQKVADDLRRYLENDAS